MTDVIDLGAALEFIGCLAGEPEAICTWQTYDDNANRHDKSLARIIHGRLPEVHKQLEHLSLRGAGVFVCINATDGLGRTAANVLAVRALFVDADEAELKLDERVPFPSMLVQSARGKHAYWVLEGTDKLEEFGPAQRRLAEAYGTDPRIHDLPRVMRLPGSMHLKDKPFRVRLLHAHKWPLYDVRHVVELLPDKRIATRPPAPRAVPLVVPSSDRMAQARRYLSRVPPAIEGAGGDEHTFRAACYVARDFGLSHGETLALLGEWNCRCDPPWSEEQLEAKVRGAIKYGTRPIGNKLRESRRAERWAGFAKPTE